MMAKRLPGEKIALTTDIRPQTTVEIQAKTKNILIIQTYVPSI
jgi:hypothetical protein